MQTQPTNIDALARYAQNHIAECRRDIARLENGAPAGYREEMSDEEAREPAAGQRVYLANYIAKVRAMGAEVA
jgi:hypothetical protein